MCQSGFGIVSYSLLVFLCLFWLGVICVEALNTNEAMAIVMRDRSNYIESNLQTFQLTLI